MFKMKIWLTKLNVKLKYVIGILILLILVYLFEPLTHLLEADYKHNLYPLDINSEEILSIIKSGRTPKVKPINSYNFTFRIHNPSKCKSLDKLLYEDINLLILVKSAIPNSKHRNIIRSSWGFEERFSDVKIRKVFLLGIDPIGKSSQLDIDRENSKNNDIVQAEFIDSYYNNTIKTMMGFKWAVQNCPKTQYVFLVDDDMYVSIKNLLKFMKNPLGKLPGVDSQQEGIKKVDFYDGRLYGGYTFDSSPMRHKTSKWYITLEEYPYSKYPTYVTAGAVALSFPAVFDMYYLSFYTKHFRFDDIYMALLAEKAGIKPISNKNFYFKKLDYNKYVFSNVISAHGYDDPHEVYKMWEHQKSLGNT